MDDQSPKLRMPQLDQFTYFTQFLWLCLLFFAFYIAVCNDGDGLLGISRILKLRNQLLSHGFQGDNSSRDDSHSRTLALEEISRKGLNAGVSYLYSSLSEVSHSCRPSLISSQGALLERQGKPPVGYSFLISSFGEISGARGMERNVFYLISKSSSSTPFSGTTLRNDIMLIHVSHGQGSIA
ncbi:hypothetical protein GIB67_030080 [Kingdonia uniflora]|uniref:H(+)-transporting two-sector ATPase n=1 Tax=Kingdonia uniflora TaxID=39325 RepID=A0A7J7MMI8_9MAGN|nr:hypothetical protein GIB67_030080 [Kingdonia uniflora]